MIIGQDECIFKQYTFTKKFWTLHDGTKQLIPKDDGQGLMLSLFCCRELGYGYQIPEETLLLVNESREGKAYSDEEAAINVNSTKMKPPLTSTPFVRELEYGKNRDGYWNYDRMLLQFEDIIDVLKVIYPDFNFIFLFDHSNGHNRMQPNSLNVNKISIRYGGKQPHMRDAVIDDPSLLGPFHTSDYALQLGSTQKMQYTTEDEGPCYLNESERGKQRYDICNGIKKCNLTKPSLVAKLKADGVLNPSGTKKELQEQCHKRGISTTVEESDITEGWIGKPKGAFQVLYERGWVDPNNIKRYTAKGVKVGDKVEYSIQNLMKQQKDFMEEVTLLQYHATKLGVSLDRTPKCHPEIAGEGIEYAWAIGKLFYRRAPIKDKRSKRSFWELVRKATDPKGELNIHRIRLCSKKARSYMKLYSILQSEGMNDTGCDLKKHSILESTMKTYLRLKKRGKGHRCVLDRNRADVTSITDTNPVSSIKECANNEDLIKTLVKKMNCM